MTRIAKIGTTAAALLGGAALALVALPHARAQDAVAAGNATHGQSLFMSAGCYECHGTVGQGGVGLRLAPSPLPVEAIRAYLRDPSGEMPPYTSAVISDAEIADIHAYLLTVPPPPKVADIPLLTLGSRR